MNQWIGSLTTNFGINQIVKTNHHTLTILAFWLWNNYVSVQNNVGLKYWWVELAQHRERRQNWRTSDDQKRPEQQPETSAASVPPKLRTLSIKQTYAENGGKAFKLIKVWTPWCRRNHLDSLVAAFRLFPLVTFLCSCSLFESLR